MLRAIPRQDVDLSILELRAIWNALKMGNIVKGGAINKFERLFAEYIGIKYAIAVSSGRAAQYLALKGLDLKENDEVILPSYTFQVVPIVLKIAGLKPIFVDVDPHSYNIDISQIKKYISKSPSAIIATHILGEPCNILEIIKLAKEYNLKVIEDCAQACGAEFEGKKVGTFGDVSYFSFYPGKNLTCLGGGMVVTNDEGIYNRIKNMVCVQMNLKEAIIGILRGIILYIFTRPYIFSFFAFPFIFIATMLKSNLIDTIFEEKKIIISQLPKIYFKRLSNIQAAIGIEQLKRIDELNQIRKYYAEYLRDELENLKMVKMQFNNHKAKSSFPYFYLQVDDVWRLRRYLMLKGIDTKRDNLTACSELDIFDYKGACPVSEELPKKNILIPSYPSLNWRQIRYIVESIKKYLR